MRKNNGHEVEVKLRVADLAALRRRLVRLGARRAANGRVHEMNLLFDTPQGGLAKHGQLLRVRVEAPEGKGSTARRGADRHAILTYKGPAMDERALQAAAVKKPASGQPGYKKSSRYKVRREVEVEVADPERLRRILEELGLRGWFRYEKYRTSYRFPGKYRWAGELHVELDETPVGVFVELEGPPEAIDRAAELLGYARSDYITKNYLALYLEQCRKRGIPGGDMLFPAKK